MTHCDKTRHIFCGVWVVMLIGGTLMLGQNYRSVMAQHAQQLEAQKQAALEEMKKQARLKAKVATDVSTKKRQFFAMLKPMVEAENQRIAEERAWLLSIRDKENLTDTERGKLAALMRKYRVTRDADGQVPWDKLLRRVDEIPVALVLVQAANESAWGTSRFAREAHNFFGQWCFVKGCGLVPKQRREGATHEVKVFASPQMSVRSYLLNLNRSDAYQALREIRAAKRAQGRQATASELAEGLLLYSERGRDYVDSIQAMLRHNRAYMK